MDRLRQTYHSLPEYLSSVVRKIAGNIESTRISTINVVYFPQLGFLITVPMMDGIQPDSFQDSGLELQFATEKVAYYKDAVTRRLDTDIGDVHADMVDMELEIIQVLINEIQPMTDLLREYGRKVSEFDCLLSFAEYAFENSLVRPVIVNEDCIDIKEGRYL